MHYFITGVAGFIGSQLADNLLSEGHLVSGVDDLSLGQQRHLEAATRDKKFLFIKSDISVPENAITSLRDAVGNRGPVDIIWHLAANSDISAGVSNAAIDFARTLQTTFAILEAAKIMSAKQVAFASTSAVYGERADLLTENSGPLLPISNYGAGKLASEALLSAAAESFLEKIWIFRFPNVVGSRATHGAIFDFMTRLSSNSSCLLVLGDGTQTKPYLHVSELIGAMKFGVERAQARRNVFNIGPIGPSTSVRTIAERVIMRVSPGTPIEYTGGDRGWVGDVPRFLYSTQRLNELGWKPKLSSDDAVFRAIDEIAEMFEDEK